jgi:hypothetical protein
MGRPCLPIIALACCALLGACMPQPAASLSELVEATGNHMKCLIRAAQKIDDAISDAATIAAITRPLCHGEFLEELRLVGGGRSWRDRRSIEETFGPHENERAVVAVLRARLDRGVP